MEAMNHMGYSAAALGEKDLSLGQEALSKLFSAAQFPILSANVLKSDGKLLASPFILLELKGHRIAVLGLTGKPYHSISGFNILDPLETGKSYVKELKGQADIIIILAHTGEEIARKLGEEEGVDLVVGGGVANQNPSPFWNEARSSLTVIAEVPTPGHAGRMVGFARLLINSEGVITQYEWQSIALNPSFLDDPTILELIYRYGP